MLLLAAAIFATIPQLVAQAQQTAPLALVEVRPDGGFIRQGMPIVFEFDQPLVDESVAAFSIQPELSGTVEIDENQLIFTPDVRPQSGEPYTIVIDGSQLAALDGAEYRGDIDATFTGAIALAVSTVQPSDGAADVAPDTAIVVTFNRPVVPLGGVDETESLPSPITIEPQIEGQGEWLNTSIYTFRPTVAFAGATEYTVTVADVVGLDGESLAEPFTFTFATASPIVTQARPSGDMVRPDEPFEITFSQRMDRESTEAAFRVYKMDEAQEVVGELTGEFEWQANDTILVFRPDAPLEFGGIYYISLAESAQAASRQGNLRQPLDQQIQVVPLPDIVRVSPTDGAQNVSPDASVVIRFNTTMSPTLVYEHVSVTPVLTTTQVFSYYSWYINELQLSWFKEPNTTYTVTIGADVADEYGNPLGQNHIYSFTTGDYAPVTQYEIDQFTHFAAQGPEPRASLLFRNVEDIQVDFYRLPLEEFMRMTGSNQWQVWENYSIPNSDQNRIWSRTYEGVEERNVTIRQVISLTEASGELLPPGIYFMESPDPGAALRNGDLNVEPMQRSVIVLSDFNLLLKTSEYGESLVWLTELATGTPVAGETVTVYIDGEQVGQGVTDAEGILRTPLNLHDENRWRSMLAVVGEPGAPNFAVTSTDWYEGIAVWDFELMGGWGLEPIHHYFYTDRAVYRAGQTVYWKGILRAVTADGYDLPPEGVSVQISINDDRGNIISEQEVIPGPSGTVFGHVDLSPEATTGFYYLQAQIQTPGLERRIYAGANFQVAEFRTPEFVMSITPDAPEYTQGETIRVDVQADYFTGGPVADAQLTWRLISEPYRFTWRDAPTGQYFRFEPFDAGHEILRPYSSVYLGLIREGTGRTNADGGFTIELPADLATLSEDQVGSQNWVFDITTQTPSNQFVSGRQSVPVHAAEYYIGLSPRTYISDPGEAQTVDVVSIRADNEPYAQAELDITIYELQWNNVYAVGAGGQMRWETSVTRVEVDSDTVTTGSDGFGEIEWTPERSGQFEIVARGRDGQGNATSSSVSVWVSAPSTAGPFGDVVVEWPRANNDRIEIVADRDHYAPGDTARILIASPFSGTVDALVTVERGGILDHTIHRLNGNDTTINLPIRTEYLPNIYVGVVLIKGIDEGNPVPGMRVGYTQFEVDTQSRALTIDIEPSAPTVAPGDTVTYTLTVVDNQGEVVPDAEVSLAVIDKGVLLLGNADGRSLLQAFYSQRPLDVRTSATLIINRDRMSRQLSEGAKGGGGGDGLAGVDLRDDFADVALWQADAVTDADGRIVVAVELPDNLTTWTLVARGVTLDTRVGDAQHDVIATRLLQVRPRLPRFFTGGDQAQIGAAILNTTETPLDHLTVELILEGASLQAGESIITTTLDARGQTVYTWPVVVDPQADEVIVTIVAREFDPTDEPDTDADDQASDSPSASGLADAVRLVLPVVRHQSPETVATAGEAIAPATVEAIRIPAAATDDGELNIQLQPSLAAAMQDGLDYLIHYPYESTEHTVSRFLPNLFTLRALRAIGIEDAEFEAQLSFQTGVAVQRLVSRQNQDGGWGYWRNERSNPFITTYVLWGLHHVAEQGFAVPTSSINNAIAYLERQFVEPDRIVDNWRLNEMAFAHFVLSELEQGDPGRMSTLYDTRERLSHYGKAYLALALDNVQPGDARAQTLLDDLFGAAQMSATGAWWQEETIDFRTLNTNTRTTAIVLGAFVRLEPDQPMIQQAIRWLMSTRVEGHWTSPQETAWTLIALADWLDISGELLGNYSWEVVLNDGTLAQGTVDADNLRESVELEILVADMLRDQANTLAFRRASGPGRLYYTAGLRYYLDATEIEPRDRGIVVDRRFTHAQGNSSAARSISTIQSGEIVSVTVTIVAPTDLHHLAVRIPVPAGLEPIDPALSIAPYDTWQMGFEQLDEELTGWRRWRPVATDFKSDAVTVFSTFLQAGAYEYTFTARAATPGEFRVLPAHAEQMYFNEIWGRSGGMLFTVTE